MDLWKRIFTLQQSSSSNLIPQQSIHFLEPGRPKYDVIIEEEICKEPEEPICEEPPMSLRETSASNLFSANAPFIGLHPAKIDHWMNTKRSYINIDIEQQKGEIISFDLKGGFNDFKECTVSR